MTADQTTEVCGFTGELDPGYFVLFHFLEQRVNYKTVPSRTLPGTEAKRWNRRRPTRRRMTIRAFHTTWMKREWRRFLHPIRWPFRDGDRCVAAAPLPCAGRVGRDRCNTSAPFSPPSPARSGACDSGHGSWVMTKSCVIHASCVCRVEIERNTLIWSSMRRRCAHVN